MSDQTPLEVADGRRLEQAATVGPWFEMANGCGVDIHAQDGVVVAEVDCDDAALIVWLRNHASSLLSAVEERDRLRLHLEAADAIDAHAQEVATLQDDIGCVTDVLDAHGVPTEIAPGQPYRLHGRVGALVEQVATLKAERDSILHSLSLANDEVAEMKARYKAMLGHS